MRGAAALLVILAPYAASAQQFTIPSVTANSGVLLTCIASGKSPRTCLGAMTLDCLAENDIGNENLEERLCTVEELVVWRDLLARAADRLERRLESVPETEHPEILGDPAVLARRSQREWQKWHETQCQMERAGAGRSDRRAIVGDACLRDLTAARYARVQDVLGRLEAP